MKKSNIAKDLPKFKELNLFFFASISLNFCC